MDLKFVGIVLLLAAAVYTAHVQKDKEEDPEEAAFEDFDKEDEVDQENISKFAKDAVNKADMDQFFSVRNRYCTCKVPLVLGDEPEESRDQVRERINSFADEAQYASAKENPEVLIKFVQPYFKAVSLKCHCTANEPVVRSVEEILIYETLMSSKETELGLGGILFR
eukprot:gene2356-17995_t